MCPTCDCAQPALVIKTASGQIRKWCLWCNGPLPDGAQVKGV